MIANMPLTLKVFRAWDVHVLHARLRSRLSRSSAATLTLRPTPLDAELSTSSLHMTHAYIQHLLNTHEMFFHALMVAHNLSILSEFFTGIWEAVERGETLEAEITTFEGRYDEGASKLRAEEARRDWRAVDRAGGKGRLKEKEKERLDESE
ncbi:hypothetical protein BOTBODRAFT_188551 [Botryobasidium botryosum FD-172 SS1]|uniref:tRNA-guanine(15) transglycosylase-like domain-containing protein n=1 Tax=Botryobasidium botryosum (strain FD-172 SS1) TaxID=930990 RepID=A0A067MCT9_BOTB1|nr:hypothetical protein BOTBODRAFT_188551 [Botryobasidium botryosum FD-172 SS1]